MMDDLISRAAAIEAIKPILYSGNCVSTLINMPAIDAIPVEWLRDKMRGYASALKSTELKALVTVMQMWQKEQEGV